MTTLLDTSVVSELRLPNPNPIVVQAVGTIPQPDVFLSVITIGEIQKGISLLPAGRKRQQLDIWLAGLQGRYAGQIIEIDLETGRIWGEITARARLRGEQIPAADGLIAATAIRHGFRIMTRNTRHFEVSGALVLNPWRDDE